MDIRLLASDEIAAALEGKDLSFSQVKYNLQEVYAPIDRALDDTKGIWKDIFVENRGSTYAPTPELRIQCALVDGEAIFAIQDANRMPRYSFCLWGVEPGSPHLVSERYLSLDPVTALGQTSVLRDAAARLEANEEAIALGHAAAAGKGPKAPGPRV